MSAVSGQAPAISLRALREADRPALRRWMADMNVIRFTIVVPSPAHSPVKPFTPAEADRYLDMLMFDPRRRSFAIVENEVHVGNVGLKEISWETQSAECFIEIGEASARGRGVGHRALELLLAMAFDSWSLTCVRLGVFEFNAAALHMYRAIGFVDDGSLGKHWAEGAFWNICAMRMGVAQWRARANHASVAPSTEVAR